jgi:hypothetical protein
VFYRTFQAALENGRADIVASSRRKSGKSSSKSPAMPSRTRRRVAVLVSLVAVLTLTSALLRALAPDPLISQASNSLFAIEAPQSLDVIFSSTGVPVTTGHWHTVYIHHSGSISGNAQTVAEAAAGLPDHFVIGNGEGCVDGEIQIGQRWAQQLAPGITPGADRIDPDCISICLVGDFNQARPTSTQQRRLAQLVSTLQSRLGIARNQVFFYASISSPAGVGRYFPATEFQAQILP